MGVSNATFQIDGVDFGVQFKSADSDEASEIKSTINTIGYDNIEKLIETDSKLESMIDEMKDDDPKKAFPEDAEGIEAWADEDLDDDDREALVTYFKKKYKK